MRCDDARFDLGFAKKKKVFELPAPLAPIADTHAHLMSFREKEPDEAIARAALAGVRQMTTIWDPLADECDARDYADRLRGWVASARGLLREAASAGAAPLFPALANPEWEGDPAALLDRVTFLAGVHPYGAAEYTDAVHDMVAAALDDPLCAGIGEIGLDYHFDADDDIEAAPHDVQMACMARQLELARRGVPVELHLRNDYGDGGRAAHTDALGVLDEVGVPEAGCILHCFGEDRATMEAYLGRGCHIAFGGAATFKRNEHVREAFAACPLDRLLFETDCPYMAPEPVRGIECEPALIAWTVCALASDRSSRTGEDPEQIAYAVWRNSTNLFGGCD